MYTLSETRSPRKYTLAAGTSSGTSTKEELPPPRGSTSDLLGILSMKVWRTFSRRARFPSEIFGMYAVRSPAHRPWFFLWEFVHASKIFVYSNDEGSSKSWFFLDYNLQKREQAVSRTKRHRIPQFILCGLQTRGGDSHT